MWEAILTFLKSLTFYTIVYPNELAVRTRGGVWHSDLEAGFHWQWPIYDSIWKVTSVTQIKEIPCQSIGQWVVSGIVEYSVDDAKKALFEVEDFDEKIRTWTMRSLVLHLYYTDESTNIFDVSKSVEDEISELGDRCGINITDFSFTTLAKHKAYRVIISEPVSNRKD